MSNITNWQNSRNESFLIVRVEKDASNFHMSSIGNLHYDHSFEGGNLNMYQMNIINLFDTELSIILDLDNATEEQAIKVVDFAIDDFCITNGLPEKYYQDYEKQPDVGMLFDDADFGMAIESLHSLARSLKLDPNYNYVILQVD